MIRSMEQAIAVQTRRANARKRGYAKAVRRFVKHVFGTGRRYIDVLRDMPCYGFEVRS